MALITGTDGNDTLFGSSGNDTFEGGAGRDIAVIAAASADASFSLQSGAWTVTSPAGVDRLLGIEAVQFSDVTVRTGHDGWQVNADDASWSRLNQRGASTAALPDGGFQVVWQVNE